MNLEKVEFYPEGFYFPAGGASVRSIAAPGKVTIARLARHAGKYWLAIVPAEFLDMGKKAEELAAETSARVASRLCAAGSARRRVLLNV